MAASNLNQSRPEDPWVEAEQLYWESVKIRREREDAKILEAYNTRINPDREALMGLFAERQRICEQLKKIDETIQSKENGLQYEKNVLKIENKQLWERRMQEDEEQRALFRYHRTAEATTPRGIPNAHEAPIPPPPIYHYNGNPEPGRYLSYRPPSPRSTGLSEGFLAPRPIEMRHRTVLSNGRLSDTSKDDHANKPELFPSINQGTPIAATPIAGTPVFGNTPLVDNETSTRTQSPASTTSPDNVAGGSTAEPETAAPANEEEAASGDDTTGATVGGSGVGAGAEKTGVKVYDAAGEFLGELNRIELRNKWIDEALKLPIKRPVQIRAGRKFGPEDLEKIYEPSDSKGAKWLSCVIQATGDIQAQPCVTCTKKLGVFADCVIVGGQELPRCANCEWNRQGCHGASLTDRPKSSGAARPKSRLSMAGSEGPPPAASAPSPSSGRRSSERRSSGTEERTMENTMKMPQATSGFKAVNSSAAAANRKGTGTATPTPPVQLSHLQDDFGMNDQLDGQDPASRIRSKRKSLPSARSSGQDAATADEAGQKKPRKSLPVGLDHKEQTEGEEADEEEDDTEEITKDMIVLRDDGVVFTEPEIMRGVPLEKISPSHPYWDPAWEPLEDLIRPILTKWQIKYDKSLTEPTSQSSRYLANRQVNRGNAVLKFLRDGPLHPYQIVGKKWITKKLFNYDTVHRLVQILDELKKFKIDVTPAQWVRQRLHQKLEERGELFKLEEEVEALYHDAKVRYIRKKSGFGNIGRPSGYRMKGEVNNSTPKRMPRGTKRKNEHSDSPEMSTPLDAQRQQSSTPAAEPRPTSSRSRARQESPDAAKKPEAAVPPTSPSKKPNKKHKSDRHQLPGGSSGLAGNSNRKSATPASTPAVVPDGMEADAPYPPLEGLDFSGFTSHDTFSNDRVWRHDWRVYQVKTRKMTSNPSVTQYYHWVDKGGLPGGAVGTEEFSFEHQVLKEVMGPDNVTWGVYKDPYDFHLRLSELVKMTWSSDTLKMIATTKEIPGVDFRGQVIVNFKRERTKRRFLAFLGKKGVPLVKTDGDTIERTWDEMESPVLPGYEDSDS